MQGWLVDVCNALRDWFAANGVTVVMRLLTALVILAVGALAIKLLRRVLVASLTRFGNEREMVSRFVVSVIVKGAWAFLMVVVLEKLGVEVGPLIAGLGVTGFVLGFAFQESLGSLASGLMLAINQPFRVGDYVQVAGFEGSVQALDMMAVTLATGDNRRVTIPNKSAWGSPIVNFTALGRRRVDLSVGIEYGSDLTRARATALKAVSSIRGVLPDPAPISEVDALDDSAVTLVIRAWCASADYAAVRFAGNQVLHDALLAAGFTIPYPHLEVTLTK